MCETCYARKRGPLLYENMSDDAPHRATAFDDEHYQKHTSIESMTPWVGFEDWSIITHRHDAQHVLYQLGVCSSLTASAFRHMLLGGRFGAGTLEENIEALYIDFRNSPEAKRDSHLPAKFTKRKLGLDGASPMISGTYKHAQVRTMFHYCARTFSSFVGDSHSQDLLVAKTCLQALSRFILLLDGWPCMLTDEQRIRALTLGKTFRNACSILLALSKAQANGIWKCTPKFHQLDHIIQSLHVERFNPFAQWANWGEETLMGLTARIRRSTHAGHCGLRSSLERYVLWLHAEHVVVDESFCETKKKL